MKPERALPVTLILKTTRDAAGKTAILLQRGFVLPVTGTISIAEYLRISTCNISPTLNKTCITYVAIYL